MMEENTAIKTNDVIGLGNALMDLLIEVEDNKLLEFDLKKGEMHLVEEEKAKLILEKINQQQLKIEAIPGGSSANTLKGIALLGGNALLCGKVGNDKHGEIYVQEIEKHGVIARINKHSSITGHALTFITPDSERTFSVHLGAAIQLKKEDVLEEDIQKSKVLHLEGYQIEGPTRETLLHAIALAKKHNTLVSIDLADPGLIRRNKEFLKELVMKHADIVFVNEKEAKEFTGLEEAEAAKELGKHCKIAIVKIGKEGSLIYYNEVITKIPCFPAQCIDTTGAGDSYAAGFLYGYCNNWHLEKAGRLGSLLASKVVAQKGVDLKNINGQELKREIAHD
ncbi:adenosine kinase [Candidatus Woesearchaeota archaeon CG_4_10_14_0_2_um_filter_33_13]|nr:MAG: adenosine kinase [Candidatus Woesearchaeota archaeon CG_4_10_14_0_2_um_filter_33_13]